MRTTALLAGASAKLWTATGATAWTALTRTRTLENRLAANHATLRTAAGTTLALHGTTTKLRTATLALHGAGLLSLWRHGWALRLHRSLIDRARAGLRRNHAALRNNRLLRWRLHCDRGRLLC